MATGAMAMSSQAQSTDPLLKKLVEKHILTTEEAAALQKETDSEYKKEFDSAFKTKTGMPEWITNYKLYGDFRGRFEEQNAQDPLYHARDRYRYRLRVGLTLTMLDSFDVGFRFGSGNPLTNPGGTLVGGQSITASQDFNSLESAKFLWIDTAYARWNAIKNNDWTVSATIGKMDNPFQLSNMIYDYDITPEGAALQVVHNFNDHHALKAIGGFFVLDEFNQGAPSGISTGPGSAGATIKPSHDPYIYGGQLLFESKWTPQIDSSIGVAAFNIVNKDGLSSQVQPFYNSGNSRNALGFLRYNFNPIIGTASATYNLASFPGYKGKFPIKVSGEFLENPGAPSHNKGFRAGVTFGKAGKKNTWELNYRYQRLEADAWFDAMVDEDNGAWFAPGNPQMAGTGKGSGWFGGTNVKGHQAIATYSFTDFMNFTFIYYNNELLLNAPGHPSHASHFMADLNFKF
jgi:hypothetical protein